MVDAFWAKRTKTGRVVYDRPRHYWKVTDMDRIWDAILRETFGESELNQLVVKVSLGLLERVLALFGAERFARLLYFWIVAIVNKVLVWLGYTDGLEFGRQLYHRLSLTYSENELRMPPQVSV